MIFIIIYFIINAISKKGMIVVFFICMLLPASISILIDEKINGKEKDKIYLLLKYLFYTFLIITIMNSFVYLISSDKNLYYNINTFNYDFCLKYMWLSIAVAVLLPYIFKLISANFNINFEIKNNPKIKKKDIKKSNEKSTKENKAKKRTNSKNS